SARMAVIDQISARPQTIQTLLERRGPHRIINYVDTAAAGEPFDFRFEILPGIDDDFVGTGIPRQFTLSFIADGRIYGRAKLFRSLYNNKAGAACAGVHEGLWGLLGWKRAVGKIMRGHALQHDCCAELEVDILWQLHELPRRNRRELRIGALRHRICNTIARPYLTHSFAD